jgi:hypothetical protein
MNNPNWAKAFPLAKVKPTRKQFYDRYSFCLEYRCVGGRIIKAAKSSSEDDLLEAIDARIIRDSMYKTYRWNRSNILKETDVNFIQLLEFVKLKFDPNNRIHIRIEEPSIRFYSDNEDDLYHIATGRFRGFAHELLSVYRPGDNLQLTQIETGHIIMKQDVGYRYKFILRDGTYGHGNALALKKYLDQLGDLVKISKTVDRSFNSRSNFMYRIWFYSNDYDIKTMIDLIEPGAVLKIHTIVCND